MSAIGRCGFERKLTWAVDVLHGMALSGWCAWLLGELVSAYCMLGRQAGLVRRRTTVKLCTTRQCSNGCGGTNGTMIDEYDVCDEGLSVN